MHQTTNERLKSFQKKKTGGICCAEGLAVVEIFLAATLTVFSAQVVNGGKRCEDNQAEYGHSKILENFHKVRAIRQEKYDKEMVGASKGSWYNVNSSDNEQS
mgnify:CR=1 FL=1